MRHVLHGAAAQRLDAPAAGEAIARHGNAAQALHQRMQEVIKSTPRAECTDALFALLAAEVVTLQRRVAELEADRLRYLGPVERGRSYRRGEMVTHRGSVWHCETATETLPPGDAWTLAVKGFA